LCGGYGFYYGHIINSTALPRSLRPDKNIDLADAGTIPYSVDDSSGQGPLKGKTYTTALFTSRTNMESLDLSALYRDPLRL
jgi:hypothetical protein